MAPILAEDLNGDVDSYNYSGPSCLNEQQHFGNAINDLANAAGGGLSGRLLYSWPDTNSIGTLIKLANNGSGQGHRIKLFNAGRPRSSVTVPLDGNEVFVLGDQLGAIAGPGDDQIVYAVRKGATERQIYNDLRERLGKLVTEKDVRHLMDSVYGGGDIADTDYVIDLFPLYEEITLRFQTRLHTTQSVIEAEYRLGEAKAALRSYLAEGRSEHCRRGHDPGCVNLQLHRQLERNLADAYEHYQETIEDEYTALTERGYLPQLAAYQEGVAAREDAWRLAGEIAVGVAGIFIPMTLEDLLFGLVTAETVVGPVARRIGKATDAVRTVLKGSDEIAAAATQRLASQTAEARRRINAVRYPQFKDYGNILEHQDILRYLDEADAEVWGDLLPKLNDDLANGNLAEALNSNTGLLDSWKAFNNAGLDELGRNAEQLNKLDTLAKHNNLGLDAQGLESLLSSPKAKGLSWDNPEGVLDALQRATDANIDGLSVAHMKFPAPAEGTNSFVLKNAKQYQAEASGDAALSFNKGGVSFDDVAPDGKLIDRKYGHGSSIFDNDGGVINENRAQSLLDQAQRQLNAVDGDASKLRWEVSTQEGKAGIRNLFLSNDIDIEIVYKAQKNIVSD